MNLERAMEINAACVANAMALHGVAQQEPPSLTPYTLTELLEAKRLVEQENDKPPAGERTVHVVCDDRMIAALYAATHFEAGPAEDPNVVALVGEKALALVQVDPTTLEVKG